MPTYDFICNNCSQRFEVFLTFSEYGKKTVTCAHCRSKNVRRRMTKVRIAKTEESRMDRMADDFSGFEGLEDDPRAMGQMDDEGRPRRRTGGPTPGSAPRGGRGDERVAWACWVGGALGPDLS